MYGGGSSGWTCSSCASCLSAGGKNTVRCCSGVLDGDCVARMPRLRLESAANVDELERVRWRSWFDVRSSCAWLAEPCRGAPAGRVVVELREPVDVLRSCRDASESVGEGWDRTGEAVAVCMLKVGETAR